MRVIETRKELRSKLDELRSRGLSIGLAPTMGNLHEGHLELVRTAAAQCDAVVATIFVNPLQFGENEDLDNYPRTLQDDIDKLTAIDCTLLFAPSVEEIYGANLAAQTRVTVPGLTDNFCGRSRPGHFDGVTTVVNKLFNLARPDRAYFGLKDYQQYLVIRKMVADLEMNVAIVGVEIQRDDNGLALSSRNQYLSDEERKTAALIQQTLADTAQAVKDGVGEYARLEKQAIERLNKGGLKTDYFGIVSADTLEPPTAETRDFAILAAAFIGPSRLIDNIRFTL